MGQLKKEKFIAPPALFILIAAREVASDNFLQFCRNSEYFLIVFDKYGVSRANKDHVQQRPAGRRHFIALFMPKFVNQQATNLNGDLQKMWTTWNIKLKENETTQTLDWIIKQHVTFKNQYRYHTRANSRETIDIQIKIHFLCKSTFLHFKPRLKASI